MSRALGVSPVVVTDWSVEPMKAGTGGATGGLFRIHGTATARGAARPWALVLKVLQPQAGALSSEGNVAAVSGREPHHYNYWRREALAYQSGLLDTLAAIRAPECYGVDEKAAESVWIWLEAVDRSHTPIPWSAEVFARVARSLGRFNGAASVGAPASLPDHSWLTRRWLRSWLARWSTVTEAALDPQPWSDPRVRRAYADPDATFSRMRRVAAAQEALLAMIERLPQSLAHLDAFSRNVMLPRDAAGAEGTVLIDWAFLGHAALGEEVAQLVAGTLLFGDGERRAARESGTAALEAYIEGLRDSGWTGDPQLVRRAYAAAASLRWGAFAVVNVPRYATADDEKRARIERESGQSIDLIAASYAALAQYLLELGEEVLLILRESA